MSHSTRAYIVNANGLPGFLNSFDVMKHLKEADEAGRLDLAKKRQFIDFDIIEKKLKSRSGQGKKMTFLSEEYPSLYLHILEHF